MTISKYGYTVKMFMKDGSIETIERDSWLLPSQLEYEFRKELESTEDKDLLMEKAEITWEVI
ncbi:hypothetical protein [Bacillus cereus]|uniref:hypothetical protein n=1 Tax=Bacillus cereus TaxID=1396 RepID=UPI0011A718AA|nr:hypothetical protein [Bacillus cereus]